LAASRYYEDLPGPVPKKIQSTLRKAVQSVSLAQLPSVTPGGPIGTGVAWRA
jgi:hypothetical protein